ncbi:MFS transporter [Brevibacillus choshinensis]|uniref:MFS transporter n=1 Tax=Brevibacillus choshinensis TaxID=54911 RepID=A0ABX7FR58_BRECH|nr:MFS transporter [Brevibacillus choshinensis]QRG67806.1 MFS transporter [Brevibacillus choshinensis]
MSFMQLHPNIRIRIVTSFLTRVVGTMIFPFMAIYFSDKLGQAVAGLLLFANVCTQILMGFYGGYLADRWGRKRVMVYGEIAQCVAFVLMAAANSPLLDSAWLTFAMMLVQHASSGIIGPAADAMLIDVSTKENRTFMYSINYWAVNLSVAIGSVLGGIWFATHRFELILGLTAVSLLTLVMTVYFMEESYRPKTPGSAAKTNILKDVFTSYRPVMNDQRFLLFSLGGLLIFSLEFQTANYVAVRLANEFHTQTVHLGSLFSFELTGIKVFSLIQLENTLLVVLLSLLITKLVRPGREANALYAGAHFFIVGYTIISYSNTLLVIVIAMFFATLGELLHIPTRQTYLAQIIRDDARSSYMAVNGLVFQGAKLAGTIGISLGAILPPIAVSTLLFMMGITGLLLVRHVLLQLNQRPSLSFSHAKGAAD